LGGFAAGGGEIEKVDEAKEIQKVQNSEKIEAHVMRRVPLECGI
jgi:hypothetical protein